MKKKALLLVLVLAFALVPVFSSVVAAEANVPKAADFNIGAGYGEGKYPATLEDTDAGLKFTQEKGYFFPAWAAGENDMYTWGDGLGVVAKEAWDPADIEEISLTLSIDEYTPLRFIDVDGDGEYTDGTDALLGNPDNWFKFTIMNQPKTLMFDYFDTTEKYSGLTISFQQCYENWGNYYPRFRVWIQQITSNEKWEDTDNDPETDNVMTGYEAGAGTFAGTPGTTDGVWEGIHVGEDVTLKFVKKNGKFQCSAKIGDDEQIIGIGLDLVGLWGGENVEAVYAGFESAMENARIPVIGENGQQETWPDGGGKWMDQIEGTAYEDKYEFQPVVVTIKDLYAGEAREEEPVEEPSEEPSEEPAENPSEAPAENPTKTPDMPQAGQDFSLAIILGSIAGMMAIAGAAVLVSRKHA